LTAIVSISGGVNITRSTAGHIWNVPTMWATSRMESCISLDRNELGDKAFTVSNELYDGNSKEFGYRELAELWLPEWVGGVGMATESGHIIRENMQTNDSAAIANL